MCHLFVYLRLDLHISERIVGHLYEGQAKKTSTRRHSQSGHIDVRPDAQTVRLFTGNKGGVGVGTAKVGFWVGGVGARAA